MQTMLGQLDSRSRYFSKLDNSKYFGAHTTAYVKRLWKALRTNGDLSFKTYWHSAQCYEGKKMYINIFVM